MIAPPLMDRHVRKCVPLLAGLPQIHCIFCVVSLRFIPRRRRLALRQALLLRMCVLTGAGISDCVAFGAVHAVRRAFLVVLAPDVSELKSDLV